MNLFTGSFLQNTKCNVGEHEHYTAQVGIMCKSKKAFLSCSSSSIMPPVTRVASFYQGVKRQEMGFINILSYKGEERSAVQVKQWLCLE